MNTLSVAKVRAYISVAVLGIAAFAAAPHAHGQRAGVQVKVPFAFENGSQHLPAGPYLIHMDAQNVMRIQGNSKQALTMAFPEETLKPATKSKVVFQRYGDRYFLREVWVSGSTTHLRCPKSRSEKRLEIAQNTSAPRGEEVALLEEPR